MQVLDCNTYNTLKELLDHLKNKYEDRLVKGDVTDIKSGEKIEEDIPAFLFRGEPGIYPNSLTSMQRMKSDPSLTQQDKTILEAVSIYVDERVQQEFKLNLFYDSAAYVQHYGLYSELLDVTSNIDICSNFATSANSLGKPGRICVVDVQQAQKNGAIADLRMHPFASRAKRQRAFSLHSNKYFDFKNIDCIKDMGLTWYEFKKNDASEEILNFDLYDISNDKFAGYISLFIDDCIDKNGKIPQSTAEILSDRIDRFPLFAVTNDLDKINFEKLKIKGLSAQELGLSECTFFLASANELNCEVDLEKEKVNSLRKWSLENSEPIEEIEYLPKMPVFALRILNFRMLKGFI